MKFTDLYGFKNLTNGYIFLCSYNDYTCHISMPARHKTLLVPESTLCPL